MTRTDAATPEPLFRLPSVGPDPIPLDTALAAVLGYARGATAAVVSFARRVAGSVGVGARLRLEPFRRPELGTRG